MHEVNGVLEEIEAQTVPQLLVFNKIDLMDEAPRIDRDHQGTPVRVWVSSLTGAGVDGLIQAISELLGQQVIETTLSWPRTKASCGPNCLRWALCRVNKLWKMAP